MRVSEYYEVEEGVGLGNERYTRLYRGQPVVRKNEKQVVVQEVVAGTETTQAMGTLALHELELSEQLV